jgi:hypothetical protein
LDVTSWFRKQNACNNAGRSYASLNFVQVGEEVVYVGITNNIARRAIEQLAAKGISIIPLIENLRPEDARAVEQALIEIRKLGKNGGTLLNKINSIAVSNTKYAQSLERGYELLRWIGYDIK